MLDDRAVFFLFTCEVVFVFKIFDSHWPIYSMFMTLGPHFIHTSLFLYNQSLSQHTSQVRIFTTKKIL
jgi:hypothetical protein